MGNREAAMADSERKKLVWIIKKDLLALSSDELFQIATTLGPVPGMDESSFSSGDEEACFEYITSYMQGKPLLELEDRGMAYLLQLKDGVDLTIQRRRSGLQTHVLGDGVSSMPFSNKRDDDVNAENPVVDVETSDVENVNTSHRSATANDAEMQEILTSYEELSQKIRQYIPTQPTPLLPVRSQHITNTSRQKEHSTPMAHDNMVPLRELAFLHRREFKIQGGQIGDQGSDITYNNVCRQIEEGLREQFSEAEIVRGALRAIKPGNFKDMLMNKDRLTIEELKGFLHSHLGEQSNMELFQELMCTKQKDNETPQQFLYRVIGLKQKILLASKHADTDVKYNESTVQDIFLHTVYQGFAHKYDHVRRELKPLLADTNVTDEAILKQTNRTMKDENERQRRLGPTIRHKPTNVHSAQVEANAAQSLSVKEENGEKKPKMDVIQDLTEKVEKLTSLVEIMQQSIYKQKSEQASYPRRGRMDSKKDKPYGCDKCVELNLLDCNHCFYCGENGHRAVGCLKNPKHQGNYRRSLPGDRQ